MESVRRDIRTRRFWKILITQAFALFGVLAAIAGALALFDPNLFVGRGWLAWLALAGAVFYGSVQAWPRPVETRYQAPATAIKLLRGDLFEQQDAHLIIGVSDTFDTAAPHIAPKSVQGQFLQQVYGNESHNSTRILTTSWPTSPPLVRWRASRERSPATRWARQSHCARTPSDTFLSHTR